MKNDTSNDATWSLNKDSHEPPRSAFWYACFRDSDWRRVRKSTKTTDKTLAQEIAAEWAQLAQAGRAGRLTESQCRNVISKLYERAVGEPLYFRTCRTFLAEWLENAKGDTEMVTYRRYQQIIDSFLTHLGVRADRLLREIAPKDIRSWRDALKAKGLSVTTVNFATKVMRMPFLAAHSNGYIELNPLTKSSVKLLKDEARDVQKDCFTSEQIAALLRASPSEDLKGAILCGYYTGLRLRDVTDLTWGCINLDEQIISVTTRKTRKTVVVPIHPVLEAWLKKQVRGIARAPLLPTLHGKPSSGRGGLSMQFRRVMERANIRGRILRQATGAGRSQSSLSFHSLRHSFVTALQAANVPVEMRQELVGHSSMEMSKLYTHTSVEVKRKAIALLPSIPSKARAR